VKVVRTRKCHPEIAGEGIKYDWAYRKGFYRRLPLSAKKTKNKFRESVKSNLDMDNVLLTVECRRLFSKQACTYMVAYSILDNNKSKEQVMGGLVEGGGRSGNEPETKPHMTAHLSEKIVKQYKSHRSAAHFDAEFINGIIDKMRAQR
jgi:hypothetical protein